jgi:hypothetical protein
MFAFALLLLVAGFGTGVYAFSPGAASDPTLVRAAFALAIAGAVVLLFSPRLVRHDRPGFPRLKL